MSFKVGVRRKKHSEIPTEINEPRSVKVGFPEGDVDNDIVARAIWNHYGTSRGIPARPFLLNAVRKNEHAIKIALGKIAASVIRGDYDMQTGLSRLGIFMQGKIQNEITTLRSPANAQSTIDRKGSSNPLIDEGEMRGAVTYKVDN